MQHAMLCHWLTLFHEFRSRNLDRSLRGAGPCWRPKNTTRTGLRGLVFHRRHLWSRPSRRHLPQLGRTGRSGRDGWRLDQTHPVPNRTCRLCPVSVIWQVAGIGGRVQPDSTQLEKDQVPSGLIVNVRVLPRESWKKECKETTNIPCNQITTKYFGEITITLDLSLLGREPRAGWTHFGSLSLSRSTGCNRTRIMVLAVILFHSQSLPVKNTRSLFAVLAVYNTRSLFAVVAVYYTRSSFAVLAVYYTRSLFAVSTVSTLAVCSQFHFFYWKNLRSVFRQ